MRLFLGPLKCFYDQQVTPYPLPKNETTGKFLMGSADTLTDLDERTDKHLSGIIFKDLVKLIDNYFYYYENGTSPFNHQDLLKNGIDFNDPQIQEILDVSDGYIYKTTHANHGGNVTIFCVAKVQQKFRMETNFTFPPARSSPSALYRPEWVIK